MRPETALRFHWLNILTKKRHDVLVQIYGTLDDAAAHMDEELLRSLGCRQETVYLTLNRMEEFDADAYRRAMEQRGLALIDIENDAYPAQLRGIADPPVFLTYRGDLSVLNQPCIALVGTREMSPYGKRVTEQFVPAFVRAGMVTVSGLALGIDAVVARETIAAGGRTVAVLGHGLGNIYPKANAELAAAIVAGGGLLLSEFPLDIQPDKFTFPARNRIIAGLSAGTVVLEAGEGSGALITAELALDYGRDVFAVPGQIFDPGAAGCHQLIARGHAKLVATAEDVLQEIGIVAAAAESPAVRYEPQSPDEAAVLSVLTTMPQSVGDIVAKSGLGAGAVNAQLTVMELSGAVRAVGNGEWVRR